MPQFQPYIWLSLITWTYIIVILVLTYNHLYLLPNLLKLKLSRYYILITN